MHDGAQLPLTHIVAADGSKVNVDRQFIFETAFNEPGILERQGIIETLERLRHVVLNVVAQFDPILVGCEGIIPWLTQQP